MQFKDMFNPLRLFSDKSDQIINFCKDKNSYFCLAAYYFLKTISSAANPHISMQSNHHHI